MTEDADDSVTGEAKDLAPDAAKGPRIGAAVPAPGAGKSRRKFLSILGGSVTVVASYLGLKWFFGDPRDVTLAILERRCGDMYVHHDTFHQFAGEYAEWKERSVLLRHLSTISLALRVWSPYDFVESSHEIRRLEDSIVTQYLLSTDFFLHGADPRREIKYLSFYDPMQAPCRNPFFRPAD